MCGIAGISLSQFEPWACERTAQMTAALVHRGPDSGGLYESPNRTTCLGFRRLAIRDLDPRADQPMRSAGGRTWIVFNGEIYNTAELARRHLGGVRLRTTGDTEVLLEAFERHGAKIFAELNGMFAAAIYDEASNTLALIRDRMGKKPLYLYEGNGFLAFSSELRSFRPFGLEPDPSRAADYFHFGYVPSPGTFYKQTGQLRPGETVVVRDGRILHRTRFFDHCDLPWGQREHVDIDELDRLMADAVACRTVSDVPLGAFLSGGVDSSLVAAQLRAGGHTQIPTFTVSFQNPRFNEAPHAARIADHLGLPHTEIRVDESRLPELVDDFLDCYEQPYVDSSGLPSMLLCSAVKDFVTVAISGDGGDEFFGGYARYEWYRKALAARRLPGVARRLIQQAARSISPSRGHRMVRWLDAADDAGLYAEILRCWTAGSLTELLPEFPDADDTPQQLVRDVFDRLDCDTLSKAACFDACYYIPDDLQVKMDRASMRVALEVRCPLLDRRVTEFGASLTGRAKFRGGQKAVLKHLLGRHVPRRLFERPKQGFGVPMAQWLRGPLQDAVRESLFQQSFRECGWLNFERVQELWQAFEKGASHWAGPLWMLFVLSRSLENCSAPAAPVPVTTLNGRRAA